jgi:DNA processing protein
MLVPGLGNQRSKMLLQHTAVDCAEDIFRLKPSQLLKIDGIGDHVVKNLFSFKGWDEADRIMERTDSCKASLLAIDDEDYPELLRHIYDPPLLLWYKGNSEVFKTPGIAVVGTRNPGRYGLQQADEWTDALVRSGITINSGLAYGVDAKAHQKALAAGGKTIAILGSGIDVIYPAKNAPLASKIIESGGAVASEYPPGTPPDAVNFPGRNRIVSGMSHGILVIESGLKGGSMITARYALDQNREVFVIPHPLGHVRGEGCNYLIRTGQGKLVQSIGHILEEISVETEARSGANNGSVNAAMREAKWKTLDLSEEELEFCNVFDGKPLHIDQISEKMDRPSHTLLPLMLELEMKGALKQRAGRYFELC